MKNTNALKTFHKLMKYFKGNYLLLFVSMICIIATSFSQIFGTYMLKDIISLGIAAKDFNYVIKYTSILGLMYTIGVICNFTYSLLMVNLSQKVVYTLRKELYKKVLSLPLSYFDKHPIGEIMSYFTNDIETMNNALNQSLGNILFSICNIVGTILGMFMLDYRLSLIASFIIIVTVVFIYINAKKCRKYYKEQQKTIANVNATCEEDLRGAKVNKAFMHEDKSYVNFDKRNYERFNASKKAFFHTQLNTPFIISLSYVNFALCTIVGLFMIKNGTLAAGIATLTPFVIYIRQSGQPFNMFTVHLNNILTMLAGVERIFNFLNEDEETLKDKGLIVLTKIDDKNYWKKPDGTLIEEQGNIVFDNVKFGYENDKLILNGISFYANKGEKIAFVGSTGAGKTTIISLINRFYDIQGGNIYYDGISIYEIKLESLRRAISVVTQDTHLFSDTIYNNIRYPRMHSTKDEVINASKIGGAYEFINNLKDKYDTYLYDDAINLSEGEKQFLSLSRAAISKPPCLILDEATSNIDTRSEAIIEKTMDTLMEGRTVLVIAHRLSTVRNATAIMVLDHGRIIERGNHEDLIKQKNKYYSLYKGITELN